MTFPLIIRAQEHIENTAIATAERTYTYRELLETSAQMATLLLQSGSSALADLQEQRVAFMIPAGFEYVAVQWGIWRAGGIAVPLCVSHPRPELEYAITHAGAAILVVHPEFEAILRPIAEAHNVPIIRTSDPLPSPGQLPDINLDRRALMLYTSGTTGKPKGVVTTHRTIQAQVTSLVAAWEWTERDRILHVLPLHHIHGIINVLTCALWVGAECHMLKKFDAEQVWQTIATGNLTLFMAVPTIYLKLIAAWEQYPSDRQQVLSTSCANLRLMVSGSAALPVQVLEKWQQVSGHFLLERYGMTEIGMALSNSLKGERLAGFVGKPLPGVEVRLVDEEGEVVLPGTAGEIQVRGETVFLEYWQNPQATAAAFRDRWFCTGDLAIVENENYRILGRMSVDIIKTGGYKVSALEIEEVLRTHPAIQDCAVVGVADAEWGERVCAAIVQRSLPESPSPESSPPELTLGALRSWAKEQLAVYKVPTQILLLEELPRNAMGKVTKPAIVKLFQ
jgi:malonyl-CoA/methylmalonyl-CoA synthetase